MTHDIKSENGMFLEGQDGITVARSSGKGRGMQLLMRAGGAFALSASMALTGCIAQEGDEALGEIAQEGDEPVGEAEQELSIAVVPVTCNSGWPGTRGCYKRLGDGRKIIPGTVSVQIDGHNGSIGHSASLIDNNRAIKFTASIHEGDAFNPGSNTTKFLVLWAYE
jgi:hypothetical protein